MMLACAMSAPGTTAFWRWSTQTGAIHVRGQRSSNTAASGGRSSAWDGGGRPPLRDPWQGQAACDPILATTAPLFSSTRGAICQGGYTAKNMHVAKKRSLHREGEGATRAVQFPTFFLQPPCARNGKLTQCMLGSGGHTRDRRKKRGRIHTRQMPDRFRTILSRHSGQHGTAGIGVQYLLRAKRHPTRAICVSNVNPNRFQGCPIRART